MKTPRFLPMTAYLRTFALVVALLLPPTPVAAADPASSSGRIASPQSETLTTPQKAITAAGLKTPLPQRAPGNAETLAPAPAQGQDADASVRPAGAPVYVALWVERAVLRVGETAVVTVQPRHLSPIRGLEWTHLGLGYIYDGLVHLYWGSAGL